MLGLPASAGAPALAETGGLTVSSVIRLKDFLFNCKICLIVSIVSVLKIFKNSQNCKKIEFQKLSKIVQIWKIIPLPVPNWASAEAQLIPN